MNDVIDDYCDVWYKSADGLQLYARDYGGNGHGGADTRTVLCMHGLTRNSADFAALATILSPRYRVIAADQRGRGRSDYDPCRENYTPTTYVQDMFALLDYLGLERVTLIGTSMGGLMAFMMAAAAPSRVAGMVINDIGPEIDPAGLTRIQGYVGRTAPVRDWEEAVARTREINAEQFPDFSDEQWLAFTRGLYRERHGVPELAYDPGIASAMADAASGAVPPDLWPLFEASETVPALVIRGALSDILSPDVFRAMAARRPRVELIEVPNRGHAPVLDEPEAVRAIEGFLAELNHCTE